MHHENRRKGYNLPRGICPDQCLAYNIDDLGKFLGRKDILNFEEMGSA